VSNEKIKKEIVSKFDLEELVKTYKSTSSTITKKIEEYVEEEMNLNPELQAEQLKELVERDVRLGMRGHLISEAVPLKCKVIAKKSSYDYGQKRVNDLKKLFSIDPKKAMQEGIGDAICDPQGNVVYKSGKTFKSGEYGANKYVSNVIVVGKRLDEKDGKLKSIAITLFEDSDQTIYNQLEKDKWYVTKLILDKNTSAGINTIGSISSVTEFEETTADDPNDDEIIDLKNKKGLFYEDVMSLHHVRLADLKEYFEKFADKKSGRTPKERYIITIVDLAGSNPEKNTHYVADDSINAIETIAMFDNRENKTPLGTRTKLFVVGEINKKKNQEPPTYTIAAMDIRIIPQEKGGYYYPEKTKKVTDVKVNEKEIKETKDGEKEKKEQKKEPSKKKSGEKKKKTTEESKSSENENLTYNKQLISDEIMDKIVESMYKLDHASFDEILIDTKLTRNEAYDSSFVELLNREILKKNESGGYDI